MANLINPPSFFPLRLSQYVPAMQYASDVNMSGDTRISFGAPSNANVSAYLSAQSVAAAGSTTTIITAQADAPYGRTCFLNLSGAGTGNLIVDGYDYLGQPMSETIALNGASNVNGKKAFKRIRQVTWPTVGAVTLNLGWGLLMGYPYKCIKILSEETNGVPSAVGTLANPDLTSPAIATGNDPRGTYQITSSTPDGVKVYTASLLFASDVDANNVGGLHGVPHFAN